MALSSFPVTLKEVKTTMDLNTEQEAAINWAAEQLLSREIIYIPDVDQVILSAFEDIPMPEKVEDKILARLRAMKRERQLARS